MTLTPEDRRTLAELCRLAIGVLKHYADRESVNYPTGNLARYLDRWITEAQTLQRRLEQR